MENMQFQILNVENPQLQQQIQDALNDLTKPPGSLGRLEELVMQYSMLKGSVKPELRKKQLTIFAADHGIVAEGVAPYPQEVTAQMVMNMLAGGAAATCMCHQAGVEYQVVDVGVINPLAPEFANHPKLKNEKVAAGSANFAKEPAMSSAQCTQAIKAGVGVASEIAADIAAMGEMGIGNTSPASALYALLLDKDGAETTGRGTGAEGDLLTHKQKVIQQAVHLHKEQWDGSGQDALRLVGGFEIAAMYGFLLRCAERSIPVVVDGFIASAAALCALKDYPQISDFLFWGHVSNEQYHRQALAEIGAKGLLDLDMRLGEGSGAILAIQLIEQAMYCYHNMATFSSAGVSGKNEKP